MYKFICIIVLGGWLQTGDVIGYLSLSDWTSLGVILSLSMSLQISPTLLFAVFAIIVKEIGIRNLRHLSFFFLVLVLTGVYVDKADNICVVFLTLMSIIP